MEHEADDITLRALADGKAMDTEYWPSLLSRLISRLEKIAAKEFPVRPTTHTTAQVSEKSSSSTQCPDTGSKVSVGDDVSESISTSTVSLTPPLRILLASIIDTLSTYFSKAPPHTIQRLAELILYPRSHYRNLPSYLHALDRVVHVTSPATLFPLPPAASHFPSVTLLSNGNAISSIDPKSISWSNSVSLIPTSTNSGADEALGGALLTPIPWLPKTGSRSPLESEVMTQSSTEIVQGPNGPGGVETVLVSINGVTSATSKTIASTADSSTSLRAEGGITQGELLRQEQEVGVVPATQLQGKGDDSGEDNDLRHARGPEEIGIQDMGPQWKKSSGAIMYGIDVEAAVGRRISLESDAVGNETLASEEVEEKDQLVKVSPQADGSDRNQSIPAKREVSDPDNEESNKRSKSESIKVENDSD